MPEFCSSERDGRVLTVTINRPEVMNALHPPANLEMAEVFDEFDPIEDSRARSKPGSRRFIY